MKMKMKMKNVLGFLFISSTKTKLIKTMIISFIKSLSCNSTFFEKIIDNGSSTNVFFIIESNLHEFTKTRRVIISYSFSITLILKQKIWINFNFNKKNNNNQGKNKKEEMNIYQNFQELY